MEGIASEKAWSRNEFGVFEGQHGQWGWEGRGGERAEGDDLREDGPGLRTLYVTLRNTESDHHWRSVTRSDRMSVSNPIFPALALYLALIFLLLL